MLCRGVSPSRLVVPRACPPLILPAVPQPRKPTRSTRSGGSWWSSPWWGSSSSSSSSSCSSSAGRARSIPRSRTQVSEGVWWVVTGPSCSHGSLLGVSPCLWGLGRVVGASLPACLGTNSCRALVPPGSDAVVSRRALGAHDGIKDLSHRQLRRQGSPGGSQRSPGLAKHGSVFLALSRAQIVGKIQSSSLSKQPGVGAGGTGAGHGRHLLAVPRPWSLQNQHNPPGAIPSPPCRVQPPLAVLRCLGRGWGEAEHPIPQGTAPRRPP